MTEREINDVFIKFVSSQFFDCFDINDETAAKIFIYLSGADDFRNELIKTLKNKEEEKNEQI